MTLLNIYNLAFFEKIHNGLDTKYNSEFRLKSVNVKKFETQPKF